MARYYETPEGKIYADVAYRLGKIIHQYDVLMEKGDKHNFDSTLVISSLQSLLSIYCESYSLWGNDFVLSIDNIDIQDNEKYTSVGDYLDLKRFIDEDDYKDKSPNQINEIDFKSVHDFIFSLRHALSHPVVKGKETGYDQIRSDDRKKIIGYHFYHVKYYRIKKNEEKQKFRRVFNFSSMELKAFTLKIATILAQPVAEDWNDFDENILEKMIYDAA